MLIVLIAEKRICYSGFSLTILEYSRIVYYSELPIPNYQATISSDDLFFLRHHCILTAKSALPETISSNDLFFFRDHWIFRTKTASPKKDFK